MPDTDPLSGIRVPLGNEADVVPADLARMREDTVPLLVLDATDEADRNAKYNDSLSKGQIVSSTTLNRLWRYEGSNTWTTLYDSRRNWRGEWDFSGDELGRPTGIYDAPPWAHVDNNLGVTFSGKSIVVPIDGQYDIRCSFGWRNADASGARQAVVMINPAADDVSAGTPPGGTRWDEASVPSVGDAVYDVTTVKLAAPVVNLSAGARILFLTKQNSGSTLDLVNNRAWTWASVARVG